ncbi:UNVERIFIED_CONTAM: Transcriptional adapter ada2 [Siphonaria sp. JEL0065]|nr:Transcriptional adapter ada2 [Siphonaria sp. JEL0065]
MSRIIDPPSSQNALLPHTQHQQQNQEHSSLSSPAPFYYPHHRYANSYLQMNHGKLGGQSVSYSASLAYESPTCSPRRASLPFAATPGHLSFRPYTHVQPQLLYQHSHSNSHATPPSTSPRAPPPFVVPSQPVRVSVAVPNQTTTFVNAQASSLEAPPPPPSSNQTKRTATDPKVLFRAMVSDEAKRRRLSIAEYLSGDAKHLLLSDNEFDNDIDVDQNDSGDASETAESEPESELSASAATFHSRSILMPYRRFSTSCVAISPKYTPITSPSEHDSTSVLPLRPRADSLDSGIVFAKNIPSFKQPHPVSHRERLPPIPKEIDLSLYKNTSAAQPVTWVKGAPLTFPDGTDQLDTLTPEEAQLCRTLRLFPSQYIQIKETVIAGTYTRSAFKKKELRQWFPIDVNKVNKLYDW